MRALQATTAGRTNMILTIPLRSVYKELHADRETGC